MGMRSKVCKPALGSKCKWRLGKGSECARKVYRREESIGCEGGRCCIRGKPKYVRWDRA